jgi:hypothetical protein
MQISARTLSAFLEYDSHKNAKEEEETVVGYKAESDCCLIDNDRLEEKITT